MRYLSMILAAILAVVLATSADANAQDGTRAVRNSNVFGIRQLTRTIRCTPEFDENGRLVFEAGTTVPEQYTGSRSDARRNAANVDAAQACADAALKLAAANAVLDPSQDILVQVGADGSIKVLTGQAAINATEKPVYRDPYGSRDADYADRAARAARRAAAYSGSPVPAAPPASPAPKLTVTTPAPAAQPTKTFDEIAADAAAQRGQVTDEERAALNKLNGDNEQGEGGGN